MKTLLHLFPINTILTYAFLLLVKGLEKSNPEVIRFLIRNRPIVDRFCNTYKKVISRYDQPSQN